MLTLVLFCAFGLSFLAVDWTTGIAQPRGFGAFLDIFGAALRPELSSRAVLTAATAAAKTIAYAATGLTLAFAIALPLGAVASGTLSRSHLQSFAAIGSVRTLLALLRSIHELVWALLFVAALGLSPLAAVLALGIPYGGILGRIYAELLVDVPEAPLQALRRSGASEFRVFWYGRVPMALPDMVSYTFYRLECGIRSAAILGWVGLGGLGFQIQIALSDLAYESAWTYLWTLVGLVLIVDLWSTQVRRRMGQ